MTNVLQAMPAVAPQPLPLRPLTPDAARDPFAALAEVPAMSGGGTRFLNAVPSALSALRANKGRSALTALGIIIGVASVIAIVALGEGASASVASQLAGLGTNVLTIQSGSTQSGGANTGAGNSTTLKASDADAIAAVHGVSAVSPVVSGSAQVIAGSLNWSTRVQAVMPAYLTINAWSINQGVAFTDDDNTNASNVAVIGQTVATNLFPDGQSTSARAVQQNEWWSLALHIRVRSIPL